MSFARVLLADDQPVVLAGLRSLVGGFCEVVGEVHDGRTLVASALSLKPDLIILSIGMPKLDGLEAARRIKTGWPEAKLLFFTVHSDIFYLREALRAGGRGYVLKASTLDELRTAIETVLMDGIYICSVFGRDTLPSLQTATGKPTRSSAQLSQRQREILQLITEGQSNKEIAATLGISVKTVDFHRARMMHTLQVHSAAELAVAAIRNGLLVDSEPLMNRGEILEPKALQTLWRVRLNDARSRLDLASRQVQAVEEGLLPSAPSPDGAFALRKALVGERAAMTEYRRLQQVYRNLTVQGKVPESVEEPSSPDDDEPPQ